MYFAILMWRRLCIIITITAIVRPSYIPNLTPVIHGAKNIKSNPSIRIHLLDNKSRSRLKPISMNANVPKPDAKSRAIIRSVRLKIKTDEDSYFFRYLCSSASFLSRAILFSIIRSAVFSTSSLTIESLYILLNPIYNFF